MGLEDLWPGQEKTWGTGELASHTWERVVGKTQGALRWRGGGMSPGEAPGVPNGGSFLVRAAPRWKGHARRWGFPPLEDLGQTHKAHGMSC